MTLKRNLYSQETKALRGQSKDIQFRLVFLYPMLFDKTIGDRDKFLFRNFLSLTFLREIFVSNYLNLINSSNEIGVFQSEDEEVDLSNYLANNLRNTNQQNFAGYYNPVIAAQIDRSELQQKIKDKEALLEKYLKTDPVFKKLMPHSQIITLKNLIDVPVITGTNELPIDSLPLYNLLLVALVTKTPLDKYNNVHKIINLLKNYDFEELMKNINKLLKEKKDNLTIKFLRKIPYVNKIVDKISPRLLDQSTPKGSEVIDKLLSNIEKNNTLINQLNRSVRSSLDELDLFFKFILNEKLLYTRYGINTSRSMSSVVKNINPHADRIFSKLQDNILNMSSIPLSTIFRSVSNLLTPVNNTNIDFNVVFKKIFTESFSKEMYKFIDEGIKPDIINYVRELDVDQTNQIKILKSVCEDTKKDLNRIKDITQRLNNAQIKFSVVNGDQTVQKIVYNFLSEIDAISSETQTLTKKALIKLDKLSKNFKDLKTTIEMITRNAVLDFIHEYQAARAQGDQPSYKTVYGLDDFNETVVENQIANTVENIINYFVYTSISVAICEYVKIIDVEIETTRHEVTDFPNYTLVIPVEIVELLSVSQYIKNVKELFGEKRVSTGTLQNINLNNLYIKRMVRNFTFNLKIPNVIVIDQKSNKVWYKFMNMTQVNNSNMNTIETFNKLEIKSSKDTHFQY